jgi:hypothetical protein
VRFHVQVEERGGASFKIPNWKLKAWAEYEVRRFDIPVWKIKGERWQASFAEIFTPSRQER